MQNNSSLLLKYNRFDASISWQPVTLINTEELFKQLDFQKLEIIPFFLMVNLSNHTPSPKSRYSLLKQDVLEYQ